MKAIRLLLICVVVLIAAVMGADSDPLWDVDSLLPVE